MAQGQQDDNGEENVGGFCVGYGLELPRYDSVLVMLTENRARLRETDWLAVR